MVNPVVWGPPLWQTLFACAWHCCQDNAVALKTMVLDCLPMLLPCELCRNHWIVTNKEATRILGKQPSSGDLMFKWLYHFKNEVIKLNRQRPYVSLDDITERFCFHGGIVDDVALGDVLVLMAITAEKLSRDTIFIEFCKHLFVLLPLPADSELLKRLQVMKKPIVCHTVRAARAARVERGLSKLSEKHYRTVADDG